MGCGEVSRISAALFIKMSHDFTSDKAISMSYRFIKLVQALISIVTKNKSMLNSFVLLFCEIRMFVAILTNLSIFLITKYLSTVGSILIY